jgi:hypothetical protein
VIHYAESLRNKHHKIEWFFATTLAACRDTTIVVIRDWPRATRKTLGRIAAATDQSLDHSRRLDGFHNTWPGIPVSGFPVLIHDCCKALIGVNGFLGVLAGTLVSTQKCQK